MDLWKIKLFLWARTFLWLCLICHCSVAVAESERLHLQAKVSIEENIVSEIQKHLQRHIYPRWATDLNWDKLQNFYEKRDYLPIWLNGEQSTDRATIVRNVLVNSYLEALDPYEYHAPAIQAMWNSKRARSKARLELLLTDALLRYGVEVSVGYQFPQSVDYDWHVKPREVDDVEILESVLIAHDAQQYLDALSPPQQDYSNLKQILAYYRLLMLAGDWPHIDHGPNLQVGMHHPQISLIKARLFREEYLTVNDDVESNYFDETLEQAVRQFQANYGHKVDGIVGYFTRQSMSVSLLDRIAAIKHNMERWRWVPRELGERYVMVNMAGYKLDLVEDGRSVLEMPVIVGKPYRAAPAFIDNIDYMEINPTWKVPPRIAKEKFLPKLQKDAKFIAKNRLKIYDSWGKEANEVNPEKIDWNKYNENWLPYKFVQQPGKSNSMGLVKFMFPNKYRIYLHDTPQKKLFKSYVRTFSSGCIRVSQPFTLANKILEKEESWSGEKVESFLNDGETKVIRVSQPLPVYLMYWTAWVDESGKVNFRNDVYQRNRQIATSKEMNLT